MGIVVLSVYVTIGTPAVLAQCEQPVAQIVSVQGTVEQKGASETRFRPAALNDSLCPGDTVRSGPRSRAGIAFLDTDTILRLDQETTLQIQEPPEVGRSLLEVIKGIIYFFSRVPRTLEVRTPFVNAAVEGTEFVIEVAPASTTVTVIEGLVSLTNAKGSLTVSSGESAISEGGRAPQIRVVVRPRDAVQWALYYEPIFPIEPLDELDQVPESQRDDAFYVRRAGVLLALGRLDEAQADINRAPESGEALALRAVIAIAQNKNEEALTHAREAVARSPEAASSRIALSYAQQANFELEAARDTLQEVVDDEPENALAWARLSELWLSLGYLDKALEAARKAASLSPDLGRTNVVLGFAELAQVHLSEAEAAFEKAISLESENPLARLGHGLALIRRGDLKGGRREIEVASSLNPDSAIIRSYLGKAYYEERRDPLAEAQFGMAKELDSLDPTAYFYDAIRKQTINRPVEALEDLQKSIELNQNRAVYRSRLMLDQDLAARSAGLGRIYRDLGFEQAALVEGWKSVNTDPGDYSGHRFLADVYSALPRHEIARVSELLQSQLLQPINIGPVQPQLAETNLAILEGSGPTEPAFNEFNPLFNRNRLSLLASGAAGGNDTLGGEVVASGVWNKLSFSAGLFHFDSDGFQENNAQDRDIFNVFVQASLAPTTSVQGEVRSTNDVRGDLRLRFDPAQLRPFRALSTDFDSARLGFHHAFSPRSDVIASFIYGSVEDRFEDKLVELGFPENPGSIAIDVDLQGWTAEGQHLYRSERFRVVSGLGHFQADRGETLDLEIRLPFPPFVISRSTFDEREIKHTNVYVYSQVDVPDNVTLTLGASGDFLDGRTVDTDQFNPKAGVTWQPTRTTTLRAAGFRTLHRSLIANQTIEPTQVAGFNQLFDAVEGEAAWRYGFAVDQKLPRKLYGGAELSWRELDRPSVFVDERGVVIDDWNERFGRAYLYSTPHARVGLSLEYLFERFEREGTSGDEQIVELSTHRVPFGVAYFHPGGLVGRVRATIVRQRGIFGTTDLPAPGDDTFAVVDASIGYRLPKRYGLITLDVRNLFDQEFMFQDTDPTFPRIVPGRLVVFRFTLTF